jgi:hypothetical protein
MKKYITDIKTLAALLMAGAAMTACSDKDEIITEQPVNPVTKYTMTVNATMGDNGSTNGTNRALALDGKTLKVKWAGTDKVSVFPAASNSTLFGTLTATESETGTTTLTGNLTGSVHVNDNLNLLFPRAEWDYTGQKGILLSDENSIEKKYDYAQANVTVAAIDNSHITTTANANFASQQAIVKFILKDKANNADIDAKKLTISAASNKLVTKKTLAGIGDKIYHSGYTADDGTGTGGEGYEKLVDGDLDTKWCQDKPSGDWYIEFHTASPIKVDGYMLRTGGDTKTNSGRNPKSWELKGKNEGDSNWTTIDAKSNNNDMPAENEASRDFDADAPGTYQYFRLDITANQGDGGYMQLSEMKLFTTATEATEINAYGPIVVTPSSATNALTVALRNENVGADTYNLTAVVDGIAYTLDKPSVTFDNGKYYEITAKLTKQTTIDLSTVTTDITVPDGFTLTGTLDGEHKISIADGATVTLDNVTINGYDSWFEYAGITCLGDATIYLKEGTTNTVKGFHSYYPGIQGAASKTLTITGTGSLIAHSNGYGAGIGSGEGSGRACGAIIIAGGTITATSGSGGAAIGSGDEGICGDITISGGNVMVNGGQYGGAGIGSGDDGKCGNITISGGTVTATGGEDAAGIGGGRRGTSGTSGQYDSGSCGNITISGGTVTATGGEKAAGIGGGRGNNGDYQSSCGTITITSSVTSVTATKGSDADNSIGAGVNGICGTVTIGGNVGAITTSPYTYQP